MRAEVRDLPTQGCRDALGSHGLDGASSRAHIGERVSCAAPAAGGSLASVGDEGPPRRRPRRGERPPRRSGPARGRHGRDPLRHVRRGRRLHDAAAREPLAAPEPAAPRRRGDRAARHARRGLADATGRPRRRAPARRPAVGVPRRPGRRPGARRRRSRCARQGHRTVSGAPGGSSGADAPVRTAWRDDLIAVLAGGLLIAGLFLDGWHHLYLANGQDGSFFTPWHIPLYAGFNACAIWTITRNERLRLMLAPAGGRGGRRVAAGPPGLGLMLVGLAIARAGVAGDAIARTTHARPAGQALGPPF